MRNTSKGFIGLLFFMCAALSLAVAPRAEAQQFTDTIFIVDESGSMNTEHNWIGSMVTDLETGFAAAGVGAGADANRYGLVGFGNFNHGGSGQVPHKHSVGGGDFGTASQLSSATSGLNLYGGLEDGWRGIDYALNNYSFRTNAVINLVLITDEDRDNTAALTYSGVLAALDGQNALLNAVVNGYFADGSGARALGIDSDGNAYLADGLGGYTTSPGGVTTYGHGGTESHYINMALATGGAAWDLNQLRSGGATATSFTSAFVDIKVEEVTQHDPNPVPEPASMLLLGSGLVGLGYIARRRKHSA